MKYFHSYSDTANKILNEFKNEQPFASFIKIFFSKNKKFGSKDRKHITQICYAYFRVGHIFTTYDFQQKIKFALFILEDNIDNLTHLFSIEILQNWHIDLHKRIAYILQLTHGVEFKIFKFKANLSENIHLKEFELQFLKKPSIFIRIRKNKDKIIQILLENKISFNQVSENCIEFKENHPLSNLLQINKDVVVQGYSSQQIRIFFEKMTFNPSKPIKIWDACAASGGKSILIKDYFPNSYLTVSDNRSHILEKLKIRCNSANIQPNACFCIDLTKPHSINNQFDLIILDVPCTGSGTFYRIPEQLIYFDEKKIIDFVHLQKKIIDNVVSHVSKNGYLLYITCSVFKQENEEQIDYINKKYGFTILQTKVFLGYLNNADCMFGTLLLNKY